MITIVIPVGPAAVYRPYLQECLDSIKVQTVMPTEVLLIDDMAHLKDWGLDFTGLPIRIHENPWLAGNTCSKNFGVALAKNDLCLFIGSDDKIFPWCIEDLTNSWTRTQDPLSYYFCDVEYDNGDRQAVPCGGAMVHKALWRATGGLPIKSCVGADDSIFIDLLAVRGLGKLRHVTSKNPPIWCRKHGKSLSSELQDGSWSDVIPRTRETIIRKWEKPTWC